MEYLNHKQIFYLKFKHVVKFELMTQATTIAPLQHEEIRQDDKLELIRMGSDPSSRKWKISKSSNAKERAKS